MAAPLLALPLSLLLLAPATQPTLTAEQLLDTLREENRPTIEDSRPDEKLEERRRVDLIRAFVERDYLRIDVFMDEQVRLAEVPLSDWPGICSVFVRDPGVQATIIHQTVDAPGRAIEITQLTKLPARLTLARDYETLEVQGNIFFVQNENPNFPGDGPVTLRISVLPLDGDESGISADEQYIVANNFTDLRVRFPEAFEEHLLPILTDIAPGFGPFPPGAATQVLLGDLEIVPKMREQVLALLPSLDAESFRDRRKARTELLALGTDAAAVALTLDNLTPEQTAAIEDLLQSYQVIGVEDAAGLRDDAEFLVFALADEQPSVRAAAAARLAELRPDVALPNIERPLSYEIRAELLDRLSVSE